MIDQLMKGGKVSRGYLGVAIQPMTDDIAASLNLPKDRGEIVAGVEPGQPAARAGIQQGDVVVKVAGQDVSPDNTLSYIVANQPVGRTIPLELIRDGKRITVNATIMQRPPEEQLASAAGEDADTPLPGQAADQPATSLRATLGVSVQTLTPAIARQIGLAESTRAVVITGVDASSDAGSKGLQQRDLILAIGNRRVGTAQEAAAAIDAAKRAGSKTVLLLIQRGNRPATYLGVDLAGATPAK